jgi:serine protease inhibitor
MPGWLNARRTGGNVVFSPFYYARSTDTAHEALYQEQAASLEKAAKGAGFELTLSTGSSCLTADTDKETLAKGDFDFGGKKEKVAVASLAGEFRWFENSTFQALAWSIRGGGLEAVALLPKSTFWLTDIERNLGWGRLQKELSKLEPERVAAQIPRADLGQKGACLALVADGGGPSAAGDKTFRADHPFLLIIRDSKTGLVLFIARVADPR